MISPTMIKIIGHMPKGFLKFLSRKVLNRYINKYANLKINGKENLKI